MSFTQTPVAIAVAQVPSTPVAKRVRSFGTGRAAKNLLFAFEAAQAGGPAEPWQADDAWPAEPWPAVVRPADARPAACRVMPPAKQP